MLTNVLFGTCECFLKKLRLTKLTLPNTFLDIGWNSCVKSTMTTCHRTHRKQNKISSIACPAVETRIISILSTLFHLGWSINVVGFVKTFAHTLCQLIAVLLFIKLLVVKVSIFYLFWIMTL